MRGVKVIPLGPQVATLMRKRKGGASSTTNSSKSGSAVPKVRLSDISNGSLSIAVLDYNNANAITEELQNKTIQKGSLNGYSSNKNTKRVKSNSDSESFGNWFGNEGVESVSHTTHAALSATTASQTDVDVSPKSEKREDLKLERTPASRHKEQRQSLCNGEKKSPPERKLPNDKVLRLSRLKEKDTCPIPNESIEGDVKAISTGIQVASLPSRRKKVASNTTNASKSESAVPKVRLSDISNGSLSIAVLDYDNANAITEELQNKTIQNGSLNGSSSDTMTDSVKNDNESVENWFGNEDIGLNSAVSRKLNVKSIWRKIHDLKIKLERIIANRQMELFRKAVHNGESNSILRKIKLPKSRILDILRRLKDNSNHEAPMLKDEVYLCMLRIAKKLMRIKEEKMLYRRFREGCQLTKAERHRLMSERRLICRIKKLNYLNSMRDKRASNSSEMVLSEQRDSIDTLSTDELFADTRNWTLMRSPTTNDVFPRNCQEILNFIAFKKKYTSPYWLTSAQIVRNFNGELMIGEEPTMVPTFFTEVYPFEWLSEEVKSFIMLTSPPYSTSGVSVLHEPDRRYSKNFLTTSISKDSGPGEELLQIDNGASSAVEDGIKSPYHGESPLLTPSLTCNRWTAISRHSKASILLNPTQKPQMHFVSAEYVRNRRLKLFPKNSTVASEAVITFSKVLQNDTHISVNGTYGFQGLNHDEVPPISIQDYISIPVYNIDQLANPYKGNPIQGIALGATGKRILQPAHDILLVVGIIRKYKSPFWVTQREIRKHHIHILPYRAWEVVKVPTMTGRAVLLQDCHSCVIGFLLVKLVEFSRSQHDPEISAVCSKVASLLKLKPSALTNSSIHNYDLNVYAFSSTSLYKSLSIFEETGTMMLFGPGGWQKISSGTLLHALETVSSAVCASSEHPSTNHTTTRSSQLPLSLSSSSSLFDTKATSEQLAFSGHEDLFLDDISFELDRFGSELESISDRQAFGSSAQRGRLWVNIDETIKLLPKCILDIILHNRVPIGDSTVVSEVTQGHGVECPVRDPSAFIMPETINSTIEGGHRNQNDRTLQTAKKSTQEKKRKKREKKDDDKTLEENSSTWTFCPVKQRLHPLATSLINVAVNQGNDPTTSAVHGSSQNFNYVDLAEATMRHFYNAECTDAPHRCNHSGRPIAIKTSGRVFGPSMEARLHQAVLSRRFISPLWLTSTFIKTKHIPLKPDEQDKWIKIRESNDDDGEGEIDSDIEGIQPVTNTPHTAIVTTIYYNLLQVRNPLKLIDSVDGGRIEMIQAAMLLNRMAEIAKGRGSLLDSNVSAHMHFTLDVESRWKPVVSKYTKQEMSRAVTSLMSGPLSTSHLSDNDDPQITSDVLSRYWITEDELVLRGVLLKDNAGEPLHIRKGPHGMTMPSPTIVDTLNSDDKKVDNDVKGDTKEINPPKNESKENKTKKRHVSIRRKPLTRWYNADQLEDPGMIIGYSRLFMRNS